MFFLKYIRWFRFIHYIGMAVGGYLIAWNFYHLSYSNIKIREIILLSFMAIFSFQSAVFLNDVNDVEGDKKSNFFTPFSGGVLKKSSGIVFWIVLMILSLLIASLFNFWTVLFVFIYHILSFIYSSYPFRIKRFFPFNQISLSLWALSMMLAGFSTIAGPSTLRDFPLRMLLLVIITLSLTFGTKDAKDVEGDRVEGIKTMYTLLPEKKARIVNAILVVISYLSVPVILNYFPLIWFSLVAAFFSSLFIIILKNPDRPVLGVYIIFGLVILYFVYTRKLVF